MIAAILAAAVIARSADLTWMAGSWSSVEKGITTRETWLDPMDGTMSGAGQTNQPGRPVRSEFMTISMTPAGLTFTAYLQDQPPTAFVAVPSAPDSLVFENLAHNFPQRVLYRRCGLDLCAGIEGVIGGKPQSMHWTYQRVR